MKTGLALGLIGGFFAFLNAIISILNGLIWSWALKSFGIYDYTIHLSQSQAFGFYYLGMLCIAAGILGVVGGKIGKPLGGVLMIIAGVLMVVALNVFAILPFAFFIGGAVSMLRETPKTSTRQNLPV